jgi:hypothetical protein
VVENGGFGRPRRPEIVMHGDRVEELGQDVSGHAVRTLLDQAEAEMDMSEELALVRWQEERAAVELANASHVMEERCRHEQVYAQALVKLGDVAADRRHRDRVLEESTGVRVVGVRCCGQDPQARAQVAVAREAPDEAA